MTSLMLIFVGLALGVVVGAIAEQEGGGAKTLAGWCFLFGVAALLRLAILGAQR